MNWMENSVFYEKYIPIKELEKTYPEIHEIGETIKPLWIYGTGCVFL